MRSQAIRFFSLLTLGYCGAGAALAAPAPLTDDVKMMQELAKGSSAEVELGNLVQQKSNDEAVKAFAARMVKDHSRMLQEAQAWAKGKGVALDSKPGEEELKVMKEVTPLAGNELDHRYIEGMLDDHKNDVAKVARYIDRHPGSNVTAQLKSTLPVLEDHLRIAENVAGHLGIKPDAGLTKAAP